ncbi:CHAT domain-containing protein [Multifurca ochricompacta]|uniref:CHAT domain-containing protein n=1 Tax=Multifurca ochricompacta TaxID=376703 RepID=A0AAD4M2U6_9AGAM|nr:CHAT domain-containing protein [Multifurca ochricompacta]
MASELTVVEIDQHIAYIQNALSLFPRPHSGHTIRIYALAMMRYKRYRLSDQKEDLDKSILHYTEAIFLSPLPLDGPSLNIIQLFFQLVSALLRRSKAFKRPEDAKYAVEYLRFLRELPLDTFDVPRNFVTTSLVEALAVQVKLEAGGTQDIEEMVTLCRELLTSNNPECYPTDAILAFAGVIMSRFCQGKQVKPLDEVIQYLREALKICPPSLHPVPLGLATALMIRFGTIYLNDDYEEAMTLLENLIASNSPGESPNETQILASAMASVLARVRAGIYPNPEYLEEAISRRRALLSSSSLSDELRHGLTRGMAILAEQRFNNFGLTEALQEARCLDAVRAAYPMTVVEEKIRNLHELISKTPPGNSNHNTYIEDLANWHRTKFSCTSDIKDIEEVIKYRRMLLHSTDTSHPFGFRPALSLGYDLYAAFKCSNKVMYLDESITLHRSVLEMQNFEAFRFKLIQRLVLSLSTRLMLLCRMQDFDEVMRLFPMGVSDRFARMPDRFAFSCVWASATRATRHPSISVAYEKAMSLMQSSLVSAPTLQIQHSRLVALRGVGDKMPLDYASYQIEMGQLSQAIETLEQGRALLWSEMRGLRNSMDHLSRFNSPLAAKLAAINKDLESLTMSVTPSGTIELSDGGSQVDDGMDPFGHPKSPGFGDFLKTPSFENIRIAASHGPVVIINHSKWRSDILILVHDSPPSLIPTTNDFYRLANDLKDRLVVARKDGLDSDKYKRALRSNNHESGGARHPFSALFRFMQWAQSHQMTVSSDTFQIIYPSYTPTLSALIESRKPSPKTSYKPSLLLVANPDESLPGAFGEMSVIQSLNSRVPVATLCGKNATPVGVVEGLRHHGFAHFVCHGTLETGKPFDASFKLFNDERLTLLDIVKSRLPAGEFAFLAACHTAELTDESIADEGLHLTAAVQYCGFRSVVGTMWEMADIDGREIAENFYKPMFSGMGRAVHAEKSAYMLSGGGHAIIFGESRDAPAKATCEPDILGGDILTLSLTTAVEHRKSIMEQEAQARAFKRQRVIVKETALASICPNSTHTEVLGKPEASR